MNLLLLLSLLPAFCLNIGVQCLDQEQFDLINQLMQRSPGCTTLLYKLDTFDSNKIAAAASQSLLILDGKNFNSIKTIQELLSVTRCSLLFALRDSLDEGEIEYLLNETRHRTVYVLPSRTNVTWHRFRSHFVDCVNFIEKLSSGQWCSN